MGKRYTVTVQMIEDVPDPAGGTMLDYTTVLDLTGPGEMLARFAPGAVAETLGAERAAVTVVMPQDVPTPGTPGLDRLTFVPEPTGEGEPAKPRTRRTKAQKAADDAAQALGFRDAAHRAEVEAQQSAPDSREPDPATPDAPHGPVVEQQPVPVPPPSFAAPQGSMPTTSPTVPGQVVGGESAVPYNPFASQ